MIFQEGMFIIIESDIVGQYPVLSVTVAMGTSLTEHNQFEGLLGNYDGVRDNDLLPFGGGVAANPDLANDEDIFTWGTSCELQIHSQMAYYAQYCK